MFNVSIPEARAIIRAVAKTSGTDLSGSAMASFRLRCTDILESHRLKNTESLLERLLEDREYCETFIRDISIGSPDMFRDPDFWMYSRDELLPQILESWRYPEFLIPECVTGNELYSLAVLLCEAGIDSRVDTVVTCRSARLRDRIMTGEIPPAGFKNSQDNYGVFNPGSSLEKHTHMHNGIRYLKPELIRDVEFRLQEPDQPACSDQTALVIYRNRMIYQNVETQSRTLKRLLREMRGNTYFITGLQESIDGFGLKRLYETVSDGFKVYRKKDGN